MFFLSWDRRNEGILLEFFVLLISIKYQKAYYSATFFDGILEFSPEKKRSNLQYPSLIRSFKLIVLNDPSGVVIQRAEL